MTEQPREYIGPYEKWVFRTSTAEFHPGLDRKEQALSCVLELGHRDYAPGAIAKFEASSDGFRFPVLWKGAGAPLSFLPGLYFRKQTLTRGMFEEFMAEFARLVDPATKSPMAGGKTAPTFRTNLPVRGQTLNLDWQDGPAPDKKVDDPAPIVIAAIIDDGVPFAHRNFTDQDRRHSRIDYCWSQSATAKGRPMLFGREFDGEMIDQMIAAYGGDEEAIYRDAGLINSEDPDLRMPLGKSHSHAAHVLDAMTGHVPGEAMNGHERVHIIAVDLPAMVSADTSGFGKDMFMLAAMHYIFDRADRIAARYAPAGEPVPLVINLSYGHSAGPHDGTGIVEAAFDEMIETRRLSSPTALVMPSGNMFLQNIHAVANQTHFEKAEDSAVELDWFLPPEDRTSTYLEVWYPEGFEPDAVKLELFCPDGPDHAHQTPTAPNRDRPVHSPIWHDGRIVGQISTEFYRGLRWRHVIALAPTEAPLPSRPAPAGRWRIRLTKLATDVLPELTHGDGQSYAGGMQLWIQRDEDFGAAGTGARQSYFIDPENKLWDDDGSVRQTDSTAEMALVRRFGTLSGMSTGRYTLRVGGYIEQTNSAATYSCAGALRVYDAAWTAPVGPQVAFSGPSERSFVHPGIVAAGTRTGITVALSGTSSAAPQAARALINRFLSEPGASSSRPDYSDIVAGVASARIVKFGAKGDPDGRERLGRFVVRVPRGRAVDDERERVNALAHIHAYPPGLGSYP